MKTPNYEKTHQITQTIHYERFLCPVLQTHNKEGEKFKKEKKEKLKKKRTKQLFNLILFVCLFVFLFVFFLSNIMNRTQNA